jgi:phthalate 4,5-dioxygenase oxygenase subunit
VAEDVAIYESMGPIVDRTIEHLGAADIVISKARRLLLEAVRAHAAGDPAPWLHAPLSTLRSQWFDVPDGEDWRTVADAVDVFS